MSILMVIDSVLALPVVRWLLLAATMTALVTATWCKIQIGTVRLQRDAAQGQAATYIAHLNIQNEAIRQAGSEASAQRKQIAAAQEQAGRIQAEGEAWRKKAQQTPLTGPCESMVNQVIDSIKD